MVLYDIRSDLQRTVNDMIVSYTLFLKDRESKKFSSFSICQFNVIDILESGLDLMIEHTDSEYICCRVRFNSIEDFT